MRAVGCFMAVEFVKDRVDEGAGPRSCRRGSRTAASSADCSLDPSTTSLNIQPSLMMPVDVMGTVLDILDEAIGEAVGAGA